jgi:PAS domain S-box-containing protein
MSAIVIAPLRLFAQLEGIMSVSSHSSFSLRPVLRGPKALATTVVLTCVAALLTLVLLPVLESMRFAFLTMAILASAWFCGFRQAVLSIMLGAVFADLFLMETSHWGTFHASDLTRIAIWITLAVVVAFPLSKLRETQIHGEKMLSSIAEGFYVLDHDWKIVYMNSFGEQLAGKKKSEVIGQSHWEAFPQTVGTAIEQQYRRCAAERVPVEFDYRVADQGPWLRIRAYPFRDGLSIFFQDVSSAKMKEEQLRAMLDRLAEAHKAAQIGTWDWNLNTNELIWSDEIPRLHGLKPETFDNRLQTWINTIHPEDLPRVQEKIKKALATKQEYYAEFRVVWPDGETHWIYGQGQVIMDANGSPVRMVGIGGDVTQRHLQEETLRRTEKLATAGRLAATIAHEINNPLEAVTNLIYLLRQEKEITPEVAALLRMADEQLARVNHIAKQTLAFYRESNAQEPVDIVQILEDLAAFLSARIASKQVLLVREYAKVGTVNGYCGELRQAFSNLITNAIDASPLGGKLILRVKQEPREGDQTFVRIDVEDFGAGILPGDLPHIFEPFFTTKADVGTGLGLWITKQLVERRGGRLELRSKYAPDQSGTCFSIILPASTGVALAA